MEEIIVKVAVITNLCTHYRYKLFTLLVNKHNFDFYFFDDEEMTKEDIKHLKIYRGNERFYYLPGIKIFRKLMEIKYDVIIKCTNNQWVFYVSFLLAKFIKAKFIVWHSVWYYPNTLKYKLFSRLFVEILRNYVDAIIVYGEHGKKFLTEKGIDPKKIFIAWQTVDNEVFGKKVEDDDTRALKERHNIPDGKIILLYVGRLLEIKGIQYLLTALNKLDKSKIFFIAIGSGELKNYIKEYCEINGIDYYLPGILPYQSLPPFYKIATSLVLPSITSHKFKEPWGLVVNEALNQGCPVVVTDAVGAGVGGLIKDGVNGFVVPEKDSDSLANKIGIIMNNDELREAFSKNALEEIKGWTYERQAEGFVNAVKFASGGDVHEST
jgi:glycosyltransferase involved in cell wall biosynthesis